MYRSKQCALWSGLALCSTTCFSGELILANQDRLRGELFAINKDHIIWASELIGNVVVNKEHIVSMVSDVALKMPGESASCYWQAVDHKDAWLNCERSGQHRIAFNSLRDIVVLQEYNQHGHQYSGKLVGAGSKSSGNRNRQDWLVDVDVTLRHFEYRHIAGLKYDAEALEGGDLREEYEGAYSLNVFFAQQTFWFVDASAVRDEPRGIDARYSTGSGIGYQFWDTAKTALSLRTGFEYVDEQLDVIQPELEQEEFLSWRLATSYRYLFPRGIAFFLNADYLQSLNMGDEWEVDVETGISLPIAGGITADVKYDYDFDNTPAEGLQREDNALRFGVGYQW